ncbi:penicillin-binding protein [Hymenobacter metallilatus]|uniref:PASTA domain-containing protein n=1 Tax=Hymenobacter metallilatus TaxID=2493666 RepID=A0A428JLG2_9BACT|nr:penicillin-binding protein [Hymenobacter metallilatus]RSK33857.1 PASTA domain-containing protein [Hymenobacter metallilatus]
MKGNVKKSIVTRVRLAFLGVCLFSCAVVWKIGQVQFKEGARWRALEQERRVTYQPVPATRGNIFASDGRSIMATSLPFYRVAWDPSVVTDKIFTTQAADSLAEMLSRFFGDRTKREYLMTLNKARNKKSRYLRLNSRQINFQEKKELAQWPIFRAGKNKGGVIFEKVDKRFRPFGGLAQRTIGFVNEEKNGAGLEFTFNRHLAGKDGEALFERLPGGNKPIYDGTEVKPQPGYDIKTTIDINLQDVAENALYKALVDNDAQYGCVILMEVKTGEIKAVANLGRVADGVYREDYNYAIADQGRTEPGSTFKLASLMAVLEANPDLQLTDTVNTGRTGSMKIGGAVKTDTHANGRISLKQVFEKSSNIGVAVLVDKQFGRNPTEYTDYLKKFGLDKPLGFQMAGEARPYIKDPRDRTWSRTSLTTMCIGYELKLAPLQTLAFYNAVANDGVKVQPIIVKEIKQADNVLERFEAQVLNPKICSDETLAKVRSMMEGVVSEGTARGIRSNDYGIAGKTGTAWKFKNGAYTKMYSTSFCGYFPAENPKYSCIVVVDSPKRGGWSGAEVSAPVFKEVADKAMARDAASLRPLLARAPVSRSRVPFVRAGMQDELTMVFAQLGVGHDGATGTDDWVRTTAGASAEKLALRPMPVRPGRVPNVQGLTLRDALFLLENRGLRVRSLGTGRVKAQSVAAGSAVRRGTTVVLQLEAIGRLQAAPVPVAAPEAAPTEQAGHAAAPAAASITGKPKPADRKSASPPHKQTASVKAAPKPKA